MRCRTTLRQTELQDSPSRYRRRDRDCRATRTQYRGAGCHIRASRSHYAGRVCRYAAARCHYAGMRCHYASTRCRYASVRCHYASARCDYAGTGTHYADVHIRFRQGDRPMRRSGTECAACGRAYRLAGSAFRCACSRSGGVGCRLFGDRTDRPSPPPVVGARPATLALAHRPPRPESPSAPRAGGITPSRSAPERRGRVPGG